MKDSATTSERMLIADRIQHELTKRNMSWAKLADKVGVSVPATMKWKKGQISKENLAKVAQEFNVSIDYFLNINKTQGNESNAEHLMIPVVGWDSDTPLDDDEVAIPFFKDFQLACSNGGSVSEAFENEWRRLRMSKYTLKNMGIEEINCAAMTATGDSMYPKIEDKSTVFIDKGRTRIKDGRIYAIMHGGLFKIKRLYNLPKKGVRIVSDNPDKDLYPTEELTAEQIQDQEFIILGWVWHIQSNEQW